MQHMVLTFTPKDQTSGLHQLCTCVRTLWLPENTIKSSWTSKRPDQNNSCAFYAQPTLEYCDNLPSWACKVTKSKKKSTSSWRHLQKNEKKTKVISYQGVFLRMYTRPEHVPLCKVKLELRTYLCVIDLWLCVFGSYRPSFAGMQIRGTAPTS